MRPFGSPRELEARRLLAARRVVEDGIKPALVAQVLGVHLGSVRRWARLYRQQGAAALQAVPHPGPKPKLAPEQAAEVLSWFQQPATAFGFSSNWWTAPRVAQVIRERFGIALHPRYLNAWLAARRITPQKPAKRPRERNEAAVQAWQKERWPALQKKATPSRLRSC